MFYYPLESNYAVTCFKQELILKGRNFIAIFPVAFNTSPTASSVSSLSFPYPGSLKQNQVLSISVPDVVTTTQDTNAFII